MHTALLKVSRSAVRVFELTSYVMASQIGFSGNGQLQLYDRLDVDIINIHCCM
jgi:hypothetical protein